MLLKKGSAVTVAVATALALGAQAGSARVAAQGNSLANATLFVDPYSDARRQADAWNQSRPADAQLLEKIASQPTADWFTGGSGDIEAAVRSRVEQITAAGALPVFVATNMPGDCRKSSRVGTRAQLAYRRWISAVARGIGGNAAVVILEPNALARLVCLSPREQNVRLRLLRDAVNLLAARPNVTVYLDAGHSAWRPAREMATMLWRAGVRRARGFSLNVGNYGYTTHEIRYGKAISGRLARMSRTLRGKRFIIDTSRNGLGPLPYAQQKKPVDAWCNQPGRALGPRPTGRTGQPLVDAFLWIKHPGDSDGPCNGAGRRHWWPEYALGLAQRAAY